MRITIDAIMELKPCYRRKFLKKCFAGRSFVHPISIVNCKQVNNVDRFWLLSKLGIFDKKDCVLLAIQFAENVLHIFEENCPNDKRPRQAVEAAKTWLRNPTEENRKDAGGASADARAAAYAAYADWAAADWAAYAAAYAAYAASAAAYAASAAARQDVLAQCADIVREAYPDVDLILEG